MPDQSQKTEKPTGQRLQKARREGRFPTSRDFISSMNLAIALAVAISIGPEAMSQLEQVVVALLRRAFTAEPLSSNDLVHLISSFLLPPIEFLMTWGFLILGLTLLLQLITTRFGFATKQLAPSLGRLNVLSRIKQMPQQNFAATVKAILLLPVITTVVYLEISHRLTDVANLAAAPLGLALLSARQTIQSLLWRFTLALLIVGIVDFVRQRKRFQKELRMTKQEIKDEMKESDGNPQIKSRIRRLQRDAVRRSMMKAVPKASVVITNPTHYAIAILYEMNSKSVPTVVAKGKNYLAQLIRERAAAHDVPIIENKPLAQALYQAVDVGQEIPPHLYRAVAEVLAYIFRTLSR